MGAGHLHPSWEIEKSKVEKKEKESPAHQRPFDLENEWLYAGHAIHCLYCLFTSVSKIRYD